jgi:hypothetical protein
MRALQPQYFFSVFEQGRIEKGDSKISPESAQDRNVSPMMGVARMAPFGSFIQACSPTNVTQQAQAISPCLR